MTRTQRSASRVASGASRRCSLLLVCLVLVASCVQLALGQGSSGGGGGGGGGGGYRGSRSRGGGGSCGTSCGIILGCVLGGIMLIVIITVVAILVVRKKRRDAARQQMENFVTGGSGPPAVHNPNGEGIAHAAAPVGGGGAHMATKNAAQAMEEGHAGTCALQPGTYHVSGTYTGYKGSVVNDGIHETSFTMTLNDASGGGHVLRFSGDGSDAWGNFSVDGSASRDGTRAAFEKRYTRGRGGNTLHYQGHMSGSSFSGTWQMVGDSEHGTFNLEVTPDGNKAIPVGIPTHNGAHVEETRTDRSNENSTNGAGDAYRPPADTSNLPPPMAIPAQ